MLTDAPVFAQAENATPADVPRLTRTTHCGLVNPFAGHLVSQGTSVPACGPVARAGTRKMPRAMMLSCTRGDTGLFDSLNLLGNLLPANH